MFEPYSQCMDFSHGLSFMILRPWFLGIGAFQFFLLTAMVIINRLNVKGYLTVERMLDAGAVVADIAIAKIFIWWLVCLGLFTESIVHYCSIELKIYGILVIVMHVIFILLYMAYREKLLEAH